MKYVSIIGGSISTYQNYNPDGYVVFYNYDKQVETKVYSVRDTWWTKFLLFLNGREKIAPVQLLVNNSYSGSKVSGTGFPSASGDRRIAELSRDNLKPDIILAYIGFNDFGYGVDILTFFEAYKRMLYKMRSVYPEAKIYCSTLVRTFIKDNESWVFPESFAGIPYEDYNEAIRQACEEYKAFNDPQGGGVFLVDLAGLQSNDRMQTLDGTHPDYEGHKQLAELWIRSFQ